MKLKFKDKNEHSGVLFKGLGLIRSRSCAVTWGSGSIAGWGVIQIFYQAKFSNNKYYLLEMYLISSSFAMLKIIGVIDITYDVIIGFYVLKLYILNVTHWLFLIKCYYCDFQ